MLKGTTKIELTNVKTGEVEVVQKENMVTNVIRDIFTMNPFGFLYYQNMWSAYNDDRSMRKLFLPVVPNLIGGILLFEDNLEENPDKYFAEASNKIVGCSSNNVSPGTSLIRGSMNQIESGVTENGRGFRFVFDFTTSQGNGVISALGLTSRWGGVAGYGDAADGGNRMITTAKNPVWSSDATYPEYSLLKMKLVTRVTSLDMQSGNAIAVTPNGVKKIIIVEHLGLPSKKIRLLDNGEQTNPAYTKQQILEPTTFLSVYGSYWYGAFVDGGDGFIYGFEQSGGKVNNAAGNAYINWIKISKEDFSFTEGTWNLENVQLNRIGQYDTSSESSYIDVFVDGGFAYFVGYNLYSIYKVELQNPTNIKKIESPVKLLQANGINYARSGHSWSKIGNMISMPNCYLQNDVLIQVSENATGFSDTVAANGKSGPFFTGTEACINYNVRIAYRHICLMTPYLATINNLTTPVIKTADKTMKITYILTETSEEGQ